MIVCRLAGFLGSGKTTFLVRRGTELVKKGKKVAVIVNEVGEAGVDGKVIGPSGLEAAELVGGCICCSLSGSLRNALREISSKYHLDIIIEPTGIAPASKTRELARRALVGEERMITICLIDAHRAIRLFGEAGPSLGRQMAGADIVAINKVDVVDDAVRAQVADIVGQAAPGAALAFMSAKTGEGVERAIALLEGKD